MLRIVCPDKSVLQVHFRAAAKGSEVLQGIEPLLSEAVRASSWYVYRSPPMERLNPKAPKEKMESRVDSEAGEPVGCGLGPRRCDVWRLSLKDILQGYSFSGLKSGL